MGQKILQSMIALQFSGFAGNRPGNKSGRFAKGFFLLVFLCLSIFAKAQVTYPFVIKGKVIDEAQKAIPGVVVTVKASNLSVQTNEKGEYNIRVTKSTDVLVFSLLVIKPLRGLLQV